MVAGCGSQTSLLLGQTPVGNSFKVEGRLLTHGFRDLRHGSQKAERETGGQVGQGQAYTFTFGFSSSPHHHHFCFLVLRQGFTM